MLGSWFWKSVGARKYCPDSGSKVSVCEGLTLCPGAMSTGRADGSIGVGALNDGSEPKSSGLRRGANWSIRPGGGSSVGGGGPNGSSITSGTASGSGRASTTGGGAVGSCVGGVQPGGGVGT